MKWYSQGRLSFLAIGFTVGVMYMLIIQALAYDTETQADKGQQSMTRVNAGLQSKKDAIERLLAGQVFYEGQHQAIFYREHEKEDLPANAGVPFNTVRRETWDNYKNWEEEL